MDIEPLLPAAQQSRTDWKPDGRLTEGKIVVFVLPETRVMALFEGPGAGAGTGVQSARKHRSHRVEQPATQRSFAGVLSQARRLCPSTYLRSTVST